MDSKPSVEWRLDVEEFNFAGCMHNCPAIKVQAE
jgi:hypothetical protein